MRTCQPRGTSRSIGLRDFSDPTCVSWSLPHLDHDAALDQFDVVVFADLSFFDHGAHTLRR